MLEASKPESAKGKSKAGPTGPRTAAGKAKSKLNASTHHIFLQGILPEEGEVASILFEGYGKDLALKGVTELEIGDGLVHCSLVERRIRKYEEREFNLHPIVSEIKLMNRQALRESDGISPPTAADGEVWQSDRSFMRMRIGLSILDLLRSKVAKCGPNPISDVELLDVLCRNWPSRIEPTLRLVYANLKLSVEEHKGDEKAIAAECMKNKELIVECLEVGIHELEFRLSCERVRDEFEYKTAYVTLPPDSVLDRIERYRCANDRRISRLLQNLETVRRLRSSGRLQNSIIEC